MAIGEVYVSSIEVSSNKPSILNEALGNYFKGKARNLAEGWRQFFNEAFPDTGGEGSFTTHLFLRNYVPFSEAGSISPGGKSPKGIDYEVRVTSNSPKLGKPRTILVSLQDGVTAKYEAEISLSPNGLNVGVSSFSGEIRKGEQFWNTMYHTKEITSTPIVLDVFRLLEMAVGQTVRDLEKDNPGKTAKIGE